MKTVTGSVVSSKPISLSKAASTLSSFLSADNGASQALCAYLRRASASFNELKQLHRDLKSSRSDRKHPHLRSEVSNDLVAAADSRRVEIDVESSDRDKSVVEIEKEKKKRKKKSEDGHGKVGEDESDAAEARKSYGKSRISANNGEIEATGDLVRNNLARGKDRKRHEDKESLGDEKDEKSADKDNDDGKDLVEMSTKKKKKKKKKREEDADELQNSSGVAIEKEELPVSDSKELKRKERKKRKNRDLEEEGGDGGSEEQQGTTRRKGNLRDKKG